MITFALFYYIMRVIKGKKIFDGEKFIEDDIAIVLDGNKIIDFTKEYSDNTEYYSGILVPGFVNTHCHLELSYLHKEFVRGKGMVSFLRQMAEKRFLFNKDIILQKIIEWDRKMWENGIVAVGDILNSIDTLEVKKESKIHYLNFVEIFGLNKNKANDIFNESEKIFNTFNNHSLQAHIVPHSPYSLSDKLWDNYFKWKKDGEKISSFHFMESRAEKELIQQGYSEMSEYFNEELGYKEEEYSHIYRNFSYYIKKFFDKEEKIILVHNTYLLAEDMELLKEYLGKIYFCLCPNANLFIETKLPDIEMIMRYSSDNICIGTDGLASNDDLSIINEINVLLNYFKSIDIQDVLRWATSNGAKALGIQDKYGYIKKGYSAPLNLIKVNGRLVEHLGIV